MRWDWKTRLSELVLSAAQAGAGAVLLAGPAAAAPANRANAPVTLRCSLHGAGPDEALIEYFVIDSDQRTVSSGGDIYRVGADPSGQTGKVITRWSDTEITLVNEEWIRNGWQRFRIVTVLDRLTGAIRSEDLYSLQTGACTVADVAKKLF